jgi:hypothetical protein
MQAPAFESSAVGGPSAELISGAAHPDEVQHFQHLREPAVNRRPALDGCIDFRAVVMVP